MALAAGEGVISFVQVGLRFERRTSARITEAVEEPSAPALLARLICLAKRGTVCHRWPGEIREDISITVRSR